MHQCWQFAATSFKCSATVYMLYTVLVLCNFYHEAYDTLSRITVINKMWARTYRLKLWGESSKWSYPHHHNNITTGEVCHLWRWLSSWHTASKVHLCHPFPLSQTDCTVLRVISAVSNYTVQLDRDIQNWFKMPSSYMILLRPTPHTPLQLFSNTGGRGCNRPLQFISCPRDLRQISK